MSIFPTSGPDSMAFWYLRQQEESSWDLKLIEQMPENTEHASAGQYVTES